ncbi:MAG: aminotransferase class I/II-fold pyridoxal phosphate-dependent enzyme [Planctomycetes bacterium]|nr:aminotransferase class I/II-fold pyridoxal phosphate-dependent enzyme [Planctomycetota bacterium]
MSKDERALGFATIAIHGKRRLHKDEPGPPVRSVSVPIYQSSTFVFESAEQGARIFAGEEEGYVYTRIGNPTQERLEIEMAFLEGAEAGLAFASGMAAISAIVFALCRSGDNLVASETIYGGTHKLFRQTLSPLAIEARELDATRLDCLERAIDSRTRLVYIETPANPTLQILDIEACAGIAHRHGLPLVVDNTFLTPYLQNPIHLGADVVVHSATKYIGGHGDTVAGVLVGKKDFVGRVRAEILRDLGGIVSPFNAWLLLRGLKTLPVRMAKHCENASEVAQFLAFHPKVSAVHYPGLRTHPQHELGLRQQRGPGGMIAFELAGGREAGRVLMNSVELWTLAVSLGDVDSLIEHPATMTHSTYSESELASAGIPPGMVRLSVGLEDVDDLVYDLKQALGRIRT